jgi:hypothetical protein
MADFNMGHVLFHGSSRKAVKEYYIILQELLVVLCQMPAKPMMEGRWVVKPKTSYLVDPCSTCNVLDDNNGCMLLGTIIAQFVAGSKGYKVEGQTGVTGAYPTQCH